MSSRQVSGSELALTDTPQCRKANANSDLDTGQREQQRRVRFQNLLLRRKTRARAYLPVTFGLDIGCNWIHFWIQTIGLMGQWRSLAIHRPGNV
jgi:hypothetical protein